jgi:hypothetical protein
MTNVSFSDQRWFFAMTREYLSLRNVVIPGADNP